MPKGEIKRIGHMEGFFYLSGGIEDRPVSILYAAENCSRTGGTSNKADESGKIVGCKRKEKGISN